MAKMSVPHRLNIASEHYVSLRMSAQEKGKTIRLDLNYVVDRSRVATLWLTREEAQDLKANLDSTLAKEA